MADSNGDSAGLQGGTALIGSERSGSVVKIVLVPDESHYSKGCSI